MDYTNIINEPIKRENKFLDKLEYMMIFLMLYISSSFYINAIPGMIILACHFSCVFILFVMSMLAGKKIKINSNMATKMVTLVSIIGMGAMSARGDDPKQTVIDMAQILVAYLFSLNFTFDDFLRKFTNIVYFLCWYSLIVYLLYITVPDLVEILPDVENIQGRHAENAIFSTIYGGSYARNQSIFWEPGAFQTYINFALIFELFYFRNPTRKRLIIYAATLITTYSTAGYITALFIVYTYVTQLLFTTSDKTKNSSKNLFFVLTLVIIAVAVFLSLNSNIANSVFGKFDIYRESGYGAKGMTSASVRFDAFLRPFKIFWKYPIFGAGTRGMANFAINERYNMNTCTFINWFAYFGIFFGAMMMQMYYKFAKRFSNNKLIVLMIFFAIFLATATENYYRNPSILVFAFFPFVNKREDEKDENNTQYQQL